MAEQGDFLTDRHASEEQEQRVFGEYQAKNESIMRALAELAVRQAGIDDGSEMYLRLEIAGDLARVQQRLNALLPEDKEFLEERLQLHDAEAAVVECAQEVLDEAVHDCQTCEVSVEPAHGPSTIDVFLAAKVPSSTVRALDELVSHPGVWFTSSELREYVDGSVEAATARAQAISVMLKKVRESPFGVHLVSEARRHSWLPMAVPASVRTPHEVLEQIMDQQPQRTTPTPSDIQARHEMSLAVSCESQSSEEVPHEQEERDEWGEQIDRVTQRFHDIPFDIDRTESGELKAYMFNTAIKTSSLVVALFVRIGAADGEAGYSFPQLIDYFTLNDHDIQGVIDKSERRLHHSNKKDLFDAVRKELPGFLAQLSPDLKLKFINESRKNHPKAPESSAKRTTWVAIERCESQ